MHALFPLGQNVAQCCVAVCKKRRFTTSFGSSTTTKWRNGCPSTGKICVSPGVLDVRRPRSDERVRGLTDKFAFHHSFVGLTRRLCSATWKNCISPQFWASDVHFSATYLHFTCTVLSVRRPRSDERVVSRLNLPNLPCGKKRIDFKEEQHFGRAAFLSAAFLSSSSQQLFFSAVFLSSSSQQLFSAVFLSSSSQQLFSAVFLSSFSQQLFSAALLSSFSQQLFSAALLSSSSQQLFSAALLSSFSQQCFSSYHWSGVGGQLLTSSCSGQLWIRSLKEPFRNAFGKT